MATAAELLQAQIQQAQTQLVPLRAETKRLREKEDRVKAETRRLNVVAEQERVLNTRLNILQTSRTTQEASQREALFRRQVTQQKAFVPKQRALIREVGRERAQQLLFGRGKTRVLTQEDIRKISPETRGLLGIEGRIEEDKLIAETTPTERALRMSLPSDLRNLSVQEVLRRQSIAPSPSPPPRTISLPPSTFEKFKIEIQQATPELSFIPEKNIKNAIETLIGLGLGTKRFIFSKGQSALANLEDFEGNKIFTQKQASNIVNIGGKVIETIPKEERGLVGLFGLDRPTREPTTPEIETELITTDVTPFIAEGGGTAIYTTRDKTFFEKFNINPNDDSSQTLKIEYDRIQDQFSREIINEKEANKQLEFATKEFTGKQIIKGIAPNAAFGLAFGLLQATPLGPVANVLLGADLLLKRGQVAEQFVNFPLETGLATSSFLAGGLVGSKVGFGAKGRVSDIKINPENLDSATFLSGAEKTKLTNNAIELFPNFEISFKKGKITDTIAYEIKLKDGTRFKVLEVSKLLDNGRVDKQFIGFQVAFSKQVGFFRPRREVFVGRGIGQIKGSKGEIFSRVIKFELANTKLGRFIKKRFNTGKLIDIVERTQVTGMGRKGLASGVEIRSIAGILRSENAKSKLIRQLDDFILKIEKGEKFSPSKLKQFINLNKRLTGEKPFTDAEFKSFRFGALTDTQIVSILTKFKKTLLRTDIGNLRTIARRVIITKKDVLGGRARTRGFEFIPKVPKKTKTPLQRTFRKESEIIRRAKEIARTKPFTQIVKTKIKGETKIVRSPVSVSASALSALTRLDRQGGSFVPVFSGGPLSLSLGLTPQGIKNSLFVIIDRKFLVENQIFRLKSFLKLSPDLRTKLSVLEKQSLGLTIKQRVLNKALESMKSQEILKANELLKIKQTLRQRQILRQKQTLRQKQILRQRAITRERPIRPLKPKLPPFVPITKVSKKKPTKRISIGEPPFEVFVKKMGKDISIGEKKTQKQARRFLKKRLSTTLRASGFILDKQGQKIRPKVTKGFRLSKVDPLRLVEKRGRRLDTGSEVKAIQEAKLKSKPLINLVGGKR